METPFVESWVSAVDGPFEAIETILRIFRGQRLVFAGVHNAGYDHSHGHAAEEATAADVIERLRQRQDADAEALDECTAEVIITSLAGAFAHARATFGHTVGVGRIIERR